MMPVADADPRPLDAVDRGFLARFRMSRHDLPGMPADSRSVPPPRCVTPCPEPCPESTDAVADTGADAAAVPTAVVTPPPAELPGGRTDGAERPGHVAWGHAAPGQKLGLVERLLLAAAGEWEAIANRIEDAHAAGATVIAVTGARRGEGRTTIVACLARALADRGRSVEIHDRAPVDVGHRAAGTIVLVDAGVWFPGGPIRRDRLQRESLGCHAAILVRRAGQPECAARGTAIESVGLRLLGEVLTMVPAGGMPAAVV